MSALPVGRSLRQFFPDLDAFWHDPAAYLAAAPVVVGPRRMYGLAALFGAAGSALLIACIVTGVWNDERFLLGIGLWVGAAFWLGWSLRLRGHSLVLRPDGVEVRFLNSVVWCPWALFNADGAPIVPAGDNPQVGLILPVAAEAAPFVELRRDDSLVAQGAAVRAPHLRFTAPDQVVLPARYEIAAAELGELLLRLGSRLGRRLPSGSPPPDAYAAAAPAAAEFAGPDGAGWYTVALGRLRFPPRCCQCSLPTDALASIPLGGMGAAPVDRIAGTARPAELPVPLCQDCRDRWHASQQRAAVRGLNLGAIVGVAFVVGWRLSQGDPGILMLILQGLLGLALGALVGFLVGSSLACTIPVEFRRYRPDRGTLQVRFRDAHYADLVHAASAAPRSAQH